VTIKDGRIADIAPWSDNHGKLRVLDASGLIVCPGFIDVHSHADNAPLLAEDDLTKLLQGVTTEIVGNCGMSLAPRALGSGDSWAPPLFPPVRWQGTTFADFLTAVDDCGYVTNYAPLVGHGTIRAAVIGLSPGPATATQLQRMHDSLDEAMESGSFGMSSGLIYPPGSFADAEELTRLCASLPDTAVYATHIRNESQRLMDGVQEALQVAEQAPARLQLSHHKVMGKSNWGMTSSTLALISAARLRGVRVHQDVYPYTASSTTMLALIPPSYQEGGVGSTLARLRDPKARIRLREIVERDGDWDNKVLASGWEAIRVASTESHSFEGKPLTEVAADLDCQPFDAMIYLLVTERLRVTMTVEAMHEEDVQRVLSDSHTMIGSDGLPPGLGGKPHPRVSGTFPRVLSRYVRDHPVLSLPAAIHKMTSLPATAFGIPERGMLAEGAMADIAVFDALSIKDNATYDSPLEAPSGVRWVVVNGDLAVTDGRYAGTRYGRRLSPAS
jgi:N-acyl-D-amino-acid deacylase